MAEYLRYYSPEHDQIAKIESMNEQTGDMVIVVDGQRQVSHWNDFIHEFTMPILPSFTVPIRDLS